MIFEKEGFPEILEKRFGIKIKKIDDNWRRLVGNIKNPKKKIKVAICGKYTELKDSYVSIMEALVHAGSRFKTGVTLEWVETTDIEKGKVTLKQALKGMDGVIVPGGFGSRGVEGKIKVIEYARKNDLPFLGLCYGLQLAVVEFARNVCGLKEANSTEVAQKTEHPVVDILPEQKKIKEKGGTMRLGSYDAVLNSNSVIGKLYGVENVQERHRHRFEVNPEYHKILTKNGMRLSGKSKNGRLVEFIELDDHKYFVATQTHPELKSRLEDVAPLFYGLVRAIVKSKS